MEGLIDDATSLPKMPLVQSVMQKERTLTILSFATEPALLTKQHCNFSSKGGSALTDFSAL